MQHAQYRLKIDNNSGEKRQKGRCYLDDLSADKIQSYKAYISGFELHLSGSEYGPVGALVYTVMNNQVL